MDDFNAGLEANLDRLHPGKREFLANRCAAAHRRAPACSASAYRWWENSKPASTKQWRAILRNCRKTPRTLSCRAARAAFVIRDHGRHACATAVFHVNHIHPAGWISSCYYVAVPPAVKDENARQGWIKFGKLAAPVTLKQSVRRAIQPVAGRLILFPSYLWHGTIPFHVQVARTTIAFDVVPTS
jgi:hypothetical protein